MNKIDALFWGSPQPCKMSGTSEVLEECQREAMESEVSDKTLVHLRIVIWDLFSFTRHISWPFLFSSALAFVVEQWTKGKPFPWESFLLALRWPFRSERTLRTVRVKMWVCIWIGNRGGGLKCHSVRRQRAFVGAGGTLGFRLYFAMNLLGFRSISSVGLSIQLSVMEVEPHKFQISGPCGSPIAAGMKPVTQALCILGCQVWGLTQDLTMI